MTRVQVAEVARLLRAVLAAFPDAPLTAPEHRARHRVQGAAAALDGLQDRPAHDPLCT